MAYDTLKGLIRQYIKTNGQNEITGQILQNVLIAMVDEYPSLTGYATQQWVQSQGYMTEADLSNYATQTWVEAQLLGYLPTSTAIINNVVQSADGSLKLSGRNFADTYLDFTHTHRFEELTDLPTTLQDYGITDVYISSGVVYLGGASVGSSTNPISNATRATSAGSASYADEAREADTLDGHHASDFLTSGALEGYATQNWVNAQLYGYLPLSAGSGNPLTGDLYMDDNYVRFSSGTQAIGYSSRINASEYYVDKSTAATLGTDSVSVEGGKITVYSEHNDFDEGMVSNELVITATGIKVNNQPFATQNWVQSQGYATQSWVNTQLLGYLPTSTAIINNVVQSADGSIKFSGRNFADTYIDFTHTHRFEELTDLPTTLQDYGITDAYISSGVVYLGGASVGSSTNPIGNATRATSAGSASFADEAREADTLDGHHASDFLTSGALEGYATQSWVNSNYLPTSALSGYATQSWVSQNYLPTSTVLVNTLAKSADGSMKFSGRNFADTYVDFTHDHRWEEIKDRPNIEIGGYGMTYTDGKFGVGIKAPSYPIDVDGSVRATSFVNSSDARLKDIEDYDADISAEAVAMAPAVHYQWKNRKDKTAMVGSIAQYWQNLIPEAVSTDDKGYLSMQYDVIALISAISIAKRTVEHERRIAELESENAQLRLELNSVKEAIKTT